MSGHLVLVLPGAGYGPLGAAIRVPVLALQERGASIEDLTYLSARPDEATWDRYGEHVLQQIDHAIDRTGCDRVTFVAKSLGTQVLASIASRVSTAASVAAVWLTPLFGRREVRRGAIEAAWPSLLIAGTADPYHDPDGFGDVARALDARTLLVAGADHSLELADDVLATIDVMRSIALATLSFTDSLG